MYFRRRENTLTFSLPFTIRFAPPLSASAIVSLVLPRREWGARANLCIHQRNRLFAYVFSRERKYKCSFGKRLLLFVRQRSFSALAGVYGRPHLRCKTKIPLSIIKNRGNSLCPHFLCTPAFSAFHSCLVGAENLEPADIRRELVQHPLPFLARQVPLRLEKEEIAPQQFLRRPRPQ